MTTHNSYIALKGWGAISPLGCTPKEVNVAYLQAESRINLKILKNSPVPVAALSPEAEAEITTIRQENKMYKNLDRTVLLAMHAARQAVKKAGWVSDIEVAINIGSSRGATELLEQNLEDFRTNPSQLSSQTSPTTTLGNISSWAAHDLQTEGPVVSHSVTCSTALQAVANGFAWLQSGMATRFLAGASEAPLTPFTVAQMQAIGIYAKEPVSNFWCRPLNAEKQNTFVLGEGAALFALERTQANQLKQDSILLEAIGFGFEKITSKTGISREGLNFQKAMRGAILQLPENDQTIDAIVLHAPGTAAGDAAEINAIKAVFGEGIPLLTSNKLLIGHTLGASAALSIEYALWMLENQIFLKFPYPVITQEQLKPKSIRRIMLLAAGFGGNASALIIRKGF
ncbi:beta-ketoacyl synthase N-terminal-like domain-containing protein [Adhaeribacter pallidiroseus]|uniref:Beta-ketoacyl-[acyl-carrier-protein] synthase II n=1 Tax=Adhaeribacter pallidiroseus TaxID=2072847 RepID=A0A369QFW6_9BACT|nr:beta-ketoacyl synthase N-terminal-like domain-containing protein [Adhaeribacter pallidiroseus]RDC62445.1 Beta-ketoacyl-[acyl-carrier-protein] synthase II [Adhaeribacter pallidiroseus]